jgi:hypothetical protein
MIHYIHQNNEPLGDKMTTLFLDTYDNNRQSLYGIPAEAFWKLFLSAHDVSSDRDDFASKLERSIIDWHCQHRNIIGSPKEIKLVSWRWGKKCHRSFRHKGHLIGENQCSYPSMRRRCASFFGVSEDMIEDLPRASENKTDLQAYFLSREASKRRIYRVL